MKTLQKLISKLLKIKQMPRTWRYTITALACVVIFTTTYALVLPAITVDKETAEEDPAIVLEEMSEEVTEKTAEAPAEEAEPDEDEQTEAPETEAEVQNEAEVQTEAETGIETVAAEETESVDDVSEEETTAPEDAALVVETAETETSYTETETEALESETIEETAETPSYTAAAGKLNYKGDDYEITVSYDEDANLPADAELSVKEIYDGGSDEMQAVYDAYYEKSLEAVQEKSADDVNITFARYFDISIMYNGEELEPETDVDVKISYKKNAPEVAEENEVQVVHFEDDEDDAKTLTEQKNDVEVKTSEEKLDQVTFKTDGFSVYGIVGTQSKKQLTDADCEAQEYSADGLTVTVKETGNSKKLSDYHVVIEDADDEYTDADVLKAYHIYLADVDNNEVSSKDLKNGKLNLKVTMSYDEAPDWFQYAEDVKHYKNGVEQSINAVKVDADNTQISFIVHGFSEFTITSGGTVVTAGGQSVTTQQGSILDGMTFGDADEWQIVSEEYTDNAPENKVPSDDGRIRVQKNVIPTDVENEFNVYLSVDTSSLYEKYFELATYSAVTQNASHDMTLGVFYDTIVISSSVHVAPSGYSNGPFYVTIKAPDGTVLINNLELYWNSSNNFTVYIATSSGYIVIANSVKAGKRYTVTLSQASYDAMQKDIVNTAPVLTSVVDTLGDYVVYDGVVAADGNVSHNNGVLTWTPTPKSSPSQTITDWTDLNGHQHQVTWNNNVAELVYKCHLDVTKDGFVSGQTYDVNKSAVLTYTGDVSGTVTFPVPQVKGTVYGFEFTKVDEAGNALPGATFKITGPSNNPDVSSSEKTATSGNDGKVSFNDLPWGTYSLEETVPPVGYQKSADSPWTLNIGYTTDLADGTITEHTGNSTTPSVFPGVWIGRGADWKITNEKNVITVTKSVETFGELDKTHINHTIYVVLWDRTDHKYVKDSSGNYVYGTIDIVNGVPSTTLTFDQYLESHSYSVWELMEQPTADMTESDIENITISPGTVIGTDSTGQKIELREITTTYADLTSSNTADASITNKYEHQNETRKFTVNKKWISNRGTEIDPPAGGKVEFTLYRIENGGEPQEVTSIILDGTEAVPWAATFQDLPSMDVDTGYSYTYMVKETSHPEGYLPYLSASSSASPMGENDYQRVDGGSIYNKKQSTDITVKKIVEGLASDSNVDFEFTATLPKGTTFPAQADGIVTSGNTASFKLKDTETITLTDIPVDVVLSITESNDGTYTTTAEGRTGGTYNNYTYTFTVVDEDGVVTFKNIRATQKVRIFKTGDDLSGAPLGGATFDLKGEEVDLSGLVSLATGTNAGYLPTQAGGADTVFTLHVGDYSLKETAAPANYNKSDDVSINVNDHGVTYKVGDGEEITAEILNDAYTVIVTDTRKRTNITVTKILEDDFSDAAENFVFHSTLMDGYTDITSQIPGLSNFTLKPGDQTDKSITFEGVPVGAELHITEFSTGNGELDIENYSTSADATGVVLSEGTISRDYSFTVSDTEENIVVTFTNTRKKLDVNLLKVDENGQPLTGASFKLTQVDENGRAVSGGIMKPSTAVDANGKLTFTDLVAGYYELEETVYPDGYINKSTDKPIFQVVLDENGDLGVVFENTEMVTFDSESITFTVKNTPGEALPNTGGTGTLPYTLGGFALIAAGALMYGFRLRRRERGLK